MEASGKSLRTTDLRHLHIYTQAAVPHNSTDMLTTPKYKIDYIKKIRNSSLK
jgi:hypothetical protein